LLGSTILMCCMFGGLFHQLEVKICEIKKKTQNFLNYSSNLFKSEHQGNIKSFQKIFKGILRSCLCFQNLFFDYLKIDTMQKSSFFRQSIILQLIHRYLSVTIDIGFFFIKQIETEIAENDYSVP
jgi:ABC-type microcin C transport system permease subunit YejB